MPETHDARRRRLAGLLAAGELDALLVTRLVNVRYLTGFTGSNGALLLTADGTATLATDGRYTTQAGEQCPDLELVVDRDVTGSLAQRAAGRTGFEAHDLTVQAYERLISYSDLRKAPQLVEQLRAVKDAAEVELLRRAARAADEAFADLIPHIRPGRTERETARELDSRMYDHGSDAPSFETIVASGPNGAKPHHRPSDRPLQPGELVVFDFGATVGGYHSDMTRTVVLGEPADWQREIYDLVRAAQRAGRRAAEPHADTYDVDAAARTVIEEAGYGEQFTHGLGHGVGLEIHETPMIGPRRTGYTATTLGARMPVTVEPGVYLPGRGGVRIEDTLVVRDGGPDLLTTTTKDLLVL